FSQGSHVGRIYLVKEGWVRRTVETRGEAEPRQDFVGKGFCFGLDGVMKDVTWPYTATLMDRAEVLEISVSKLRDQVALRAELINGLGRYVAPEFCSDKAGMKPAVAREITHAQESLIETGLVDGGNLLVMDMDLCVRCGNCSLACHKVHGQSRLLRRGIHVNRLMAPRKSARQSLLSPQVCMHCQDPECLTGCPTGAIGRFGSGQIDIEPRTCIGCGDCATQCPYDAITMIPRKAGAPAAKLNLVGRLRDMFRVSLDPLPAAIDQTDDLVAVKCNLCANTGLNPAGAKGKAYSCEENCPTGALARVDPRQYLDEVGKIQGFLMVDATHGVGRNIHKSDGPKRLLHIGGTLLTLALTAAAIWGLHTYGLGGKIFSFLNMRWITGLVGLAGIAGVMTYPVRRQKYVKRAGPLR
ncbi:MAG: 4Fe-4S dicluster domain-containing protein, partial [Blastocatellia bacterium]